MYQRPDSQIKKADNSGRQQCIINHAERDVFYDEIEFNKQFVDKLIRLSILQWHL